MLNLKMNKLNSFFKYRLCAVIISGIIITVILALSFLNINRDFFPDLLTKVCLDSRVYISFGYMIGLLFLLFLCFSKYGKIKLGGKDATPEYSNLSWFNCLFMAGTGIGVLFYSQEAIFHLNDNPYYDGIGGDPNAVSYALIIHNWGIIPWSLYAWMGIIVGYFHFNHNRALKISSIVPLRTHSFVRNSLDIIMTLGIIAGLTTSLGLGVSQLRSGLMYVFNFDMNPYLLMFLIEVIAIFSVVTGLKRGIKWLSNISIALVIMLLITIFTLGFFYFDITTLFSYITNGIGSYLTNVPEFSNPFDEVSNKWAVSWSVYYQLWYVAWSVFVGVFVARISKGRTLRAFIIAVVLAPTLFSIIWFGVFGNIGKEFAEELYPVMNSDITRSLFVFLERITTEVSYELLSGFVMILISLFFITSSDSGAYVITSLLSKDNKVRTLDKIYWSFVLCFTSMFLFYYGGLHLVQAVAVIMGLFVLTIMIIVTPYFIYKIIILP